MSNTKKQPQEAQVGDRVWARQGDTMVAGHITETKIFFGDDRGSMVRIFGSAYGLDEFKDAWDFLAADETVIGGVLIKPSQNQQGCWVVGEFRFGPNAINGLTPESTYARKYGLSSANISEIQEHVRKHSAPTIVPKKRSAADAKVGDEVWVIDSTNYVKFDGVIRIIEPHGRGWKLTIAVGISYYIRFHHEFGVDWGFPEDRPDTTKEFPVDQPAPDKERPLPPQLGNVALLIKAKGSDWVKANYPDLWDAYKAAGLEKVRSAAEKLARSGPLAGKIPNLH